MHLPSLTNQPSQFPLPTSFLPKTQIQLHWFTNHFSTMTTVAKLPLPPLDCHNHSLQPPPSRIILRDALAVKARRRIWIRPCRSFKSDQEGSGLREREKQVMQSREEKIVNKFVEGIRDAVWRMSKPSLRSEAMEKLEETLFSVSAFQISARIWWFRWKLEYFYACLILYKVNIW